MTIDIKTKLSLNWIDEYYDPTRTYNINDALYYENSSYRCFREPSLNHTPINTSYWKPVVLSSSSLITSVGDIVYKKDDHSEILHPPQNKSYLTSNSYGYPVYNEVTNKASRHLLMKKMGVVNKTNNHRMGYINFDDELYVSGRNNYGQLGIGHTTDQSLLVKIPKPPDMGVPIDLYLGTSSTFVVDNLGQVFSCGNNNTGQLGLGDLDDRNLLTKISVPDNVKIVKVIQGEGGLRIYSDIIYDSTFLMDEEGYLYGSGKNNGGQLGLGYSTDRDTFTRLPGVYDDVAKSGQHCGIIYAVRKSDRHVMGWGHSDSYSSWGILGVGHGDCVYNPTDLPVNELGKNPVSVHNTSLLHANNYSYGACFTLMEDGTLYGSGINYGAIGSGTTSTWIPTYEKTLLDNIDFFATGGCCTSHNTSCIAISDGHLFTWGKNYNGRLGWGPLNVISATPNEPMPDKTDWLDGIVVGERNLIVRDINGKLYSCGYNIHGQLGNATNIEAHEFTEMLTPPDWTIKQMQCHGFSTDDTNNMGIAILLEDGRAFTLGCNCYGQNGNNFDNLNTSVFTQVKDMNGI
jgi:alpha-tubulin suppressor-like RCC1 family protein